MPNALKYFPIDAPVSFDCDRSDLLGFDWQNTAADFIIPDDDNHVLRVSFDSDVIVRMLDEMPLSTESDPSTWEGLVPNHFAYRVEGSTFAAVQSGVWVETRDSVQHYQFVTGWGCLDVLSVAEPAFSVIPRRLAITQSNWDVDRATRSA
jgi:hypothetical protein